MAKSVTKKQATRKLNPAPKAGESVTLGDLKHDPANCRRHNPRNIGAIVNALHKVGAARSIVIDEDNVILAGNGLVEAAGEAGIEKVKVVEADGSTVVAVRRTGLTPKQKAELAIADNRTAELAEWDAETLQKVAAEHDIDLSGLDFSPEDMAALMAEGAVGQEVTEDEAPEVSEGPAVAARGDLWALGEHRLLCGDSTDPADVGRLMGTQRAVLMVADPPYGVKLDQSWRDEALGEKALGKGNAATIESDDRADWTDAYRLFNGNVAYVWHATLFTDLLKRNLEDAGFEVRQMIIWNKSIMVMGRSAYHWKHEPCWYAVRKGKDANWQGDRTQTTVWDAASPNHIMSGSKEDKTEHPSQKPVEIHAKPVKNHTVRGDVVYDPFLGSGTTLIACEQLGRRCYGLEISPNYCDVILRRWMKLTGQSPVREDGAKFADLAPAEEVNA